MLADKLETRLAADGTVEVVARTDFDEAFGPLSSNALGLVDATLAKRIGSAGGIDAIVTGTVAILPSEVVIHCRIVDTVSGKSMAVTQTRAVRDHDAAQDLDLLLQHGLHPRVVPVR